MCSNADDKRCLYSDIVSVSIRKSASRQAGYRKSQLSDRGNCVAQCLQHAPSVESTDVDSVRSWPQCHFSGCHDAW
jgi:hypothetical protein